MFQADVRLLIGEAIKPLGYELLTESILSRPMSWPSAASKFTTVALKPASMKGAASPGPRFNNSRVLLHPGPFLDDAERVSSLTFVNPD